MTLTNLAVLPDWHHHLHPLLPHLLHHLTNYSDNNRVLEKLKLQSSRLLVNITCNDDNIPHLLHSRCPSPVLQLVNRSCHEDQLLRNVTLVSNICCAAQRLGCVDWKHEASASVVEDTLLGRISSERINVLSEVQHLMENHKNSDIRLQARKIHVALSM